MNGLGSRLIGWMAAVIASAAVFLIFNDIIFNVTFWRSAFGNVWVMSDSCLIEQVDDKGRPDLATLRDAPSLKTDQLKFPLRLNPNLNYFVATDRAARITCSLNPEIKDKPSSESQWLLLGPVDGDLTLWVDGVLAFSIIGESAFPVIPVASNKGSIEIKILTRTLQNGQLAMTSLYPISIANSWRDIVTIQKVYAFSRATLPFGTIMLFIGLSVLFVVSYNCGIRYPDVLWTMLALVIGLIELLLKWRIGLSSWWNYEMQLAVYSCLAVALANHIHRDISIRLQLIMFCIPSFVSVSLALLSPELRGVIVTGFKVTSWLQVVLYSFVAASGLRKVNLLPTGRSLARQIGIYIACLVALGLVATNLLIEIKGIWLREIMMFFTITAITGIIATDLVLFHRGYFKEKALRTDEQIRREQEEREKLRLAEALLIGQTAQELLLPMNIERQHKNIRLQYRCQPHITMAGDWMDSWEGPDGQVIILLGDVSGKGPSAAIAMASIMTLTQEFRMNHNNLKRAVEIMSPRIFDLFKGAIVSTWAGVEILPDGTMSFSGGGSPGWFLLAPDRCTTLSCRLPMMGLSKEPIPFQSETIPFHANTTVVSVSDGICGSSRQLRQFTERLKTIGSKTSEEIISELFDFASKQKIADDRSLVVIERLIDASKPDETTGIPA